MRIRFCGINALDIGLALDKICKLSGGRITTCNIYINIKKKTKRLEIYNTNDFDEVFLDFGHVNDISELLEEIDDYMDEVTYLSKQEHEKCRELYEFLFDSIEEDERILIKEIIQKIIKKQFK